ncbi:DUF4148 domain-containing protein [Paraburkholderia pallida]|uniref:DUF4148 domain-containing protein n=1 Tax=Paraburkholderia pallida TaxID=2547399 RepID=A0A4P7CZ60_9BURK|nr:DUF4148 domain-containing protein [Paraburkholderia pallida]QBR01619.1 DUF4148 domain-containing protein [Paraburkholderia pallida]
MKTPLIAALLVAVSAAVAAPAFADANDAPLTRTQVRHELVQLESTGYATTRLNGSSYPDNVQVALARVHANDGSDAGYGGTADGASQAGSKIAMGAATPSLFAHH